MGGYTIPRILKEKTLGDNEENKLLIAKITDKIKTSRTQNKITNSYFLNEFQISMVEKQLLKMQEKQYFFFGGYDEATRKILVSYPDKLEKDTVIDNINDIINAIKIELPKEIQGELKHKDYLGILMSFGLSRERIGDIIVYTNRAYIIVLKENAEYIKTSFEQERKFKKAKIEIVNLSKIEPKSIEYDNINISVNSLRLDNIISEILKTSRKIAQEYLEQEKVYINYSEETKSSKTIKEKDILVIRGKGKYIIESFLGRNKKR